MAIREVIIQDGEFRPKVLLTDNLQDEADLRQLAEELDWQYLFTGVVRQPESQPKVYFSAGPSHNRFRKAIEAEVGDLDKVGWMQGQLFFGPLTRLLKALYVSNGPMHANLPPRELKLAEASMSTIMRGINPTFVWQPFTATLNEGYRYLYISGLRRFRILHQPEPEIT